jgi:Zn-dependent peptidase ImmA (M78 family)
MKKYNDFLNTATYASSLLQYLINQGMELSTPINIEGILSFLELNYHSKPDFRDMKTTGSIKVVENEPMIWANPFKNKFKERKRFTLAHELGHFMLHIAPLGSINNFQPILDESLSFNRDDNWNYKEMEANNFAAQLLMPVEFIKKEIERIHTQNGNMSQEEAIEVLAETFNVSSQAMEYRLKSIGALV